MTITQLRYAAVFLVAVVAVTACSHKTFPVSSTRSSNTGNIAGNNAADTANLQQDILLNINQYRQSVGLPPLQLLDVASAQAKRHSTSMANKLTPLGHTGFEARVSAISKSLGKNLSAAAENVAEGKLSAKQVVAGWVHSPGHKKNIEGNYTFTGIGYAVDPGGIIYFTQIFLHK